MEHGLELLEECDLFNYGYLYIIILCAIINTQSLQLLFTEMTEQQQHLQSVIQQGQTLIEEINKLNDEVASKRALLTKLQGVAEYLDQIGIKLPEEPAEGEEGEEAAAEPVTAEVE